jgi:hypothetical protein
MKRSWSIIAAYVLCVSAGAQNLVPNGSFEDYTQCPEFFGYAQYAAGWLNLHTSSADYFNRCQENLIVGVPFNNFGYQEPGEGNSYVGMATTAVAGVPWYREIVGIELAEPLQPSVPICLSFQTAMGGFGSWYGNSTIYSSKGLGLKFFMDLPTDWQSYLYPNSAALHIDVVPTDTAAWYYVSGLYTPDSAYRYLAVGNFFADSLSEITLIDSTGFGAADVAYAFVDDVRASFDLSFCTTGVGMTGFASRAVQVYPTPCEETLNVAFEHPISGVLHYRLVDACGRVALAGSSPSVSTRLAINTAALHTGLFCLQLTDGNGPYRAIQVVHVSP